jgi:hypothetical protein
MFQFRIQCSSVLNNGQKNGETYFFDCPVLKTSKVIGYIIRRKGN